VNTYL